MINDFVLADSRCRRAAFDAHQQRLSNTTSAWKKISRRKRPARTAAASVEFDAADLAARIERAHAIRTRPLPFGVILIDREGTVLFYSETEARESGYGGSPLGQNLFAISSRMGSDDFRGRIMRAAEERPVDLEFGWPGDYGDSHTRIAHPRAVLAPARLLDIHRARRRRRLLAKISYQGLDRSWSPAGLAGMARRESGARQMRTVARAAAAVQRTPAAQSGIRYPMLFHQGPRAANPMTAMATAVAMRRNGAGYSLLRLMS